MARPGIAGTVLTAAATAVASARPAAWPRVGDSHPRWLESTMFFQISARPSCRPDRCRAGRASETLHVGWRARSWRPPRRPRRTAGAGTIMKAVRAARPFCFISACRAAMGSSAPTRRQRPDARNATTASLHAHQKCSGGLSWGRASWHRPAVGSKAKSAGHVNIDRQFIRTWSPELAPRRARAPPLPRPIVKSITVGRGD